MIKYIGVNSLRKPDVPFKFVVRTDEAILYFNYGLYIKGSSCLLYKKFPYFQNHRIVNFCTESDIITYMSYDKIPTMKTIIHVEHQNIGKNNLPVLSIIEDDNRIYCSNIELSGPCVLKYNKECPRVSGISCWIETDDPIKILS